MKIAVAYKENSVIPHFGKTEVFKVYDTEGTEISDITVEGSGHDVRVEALKEQNINVVICGGLGEGAQNGLRSAGIVFVVCDDSDPDQAVSDYLNGELDDERETSGCGCGGDCGGEDEDGCGCGGSCGGGCGGCAPQIVLEGKNAGKICKVHYKGTFNDGTQFDSSYDRGEALEFICGAGQMIKGFDEAVLNMEIGEEVDIHLMPEDAYGMPDENAIFTLAIEELPGSESLEIGQQVYVSNQFGQQFPVKVTAKDDQQITLDANHEMAGKELNFHIALISAEER